tara:strand:- start:320 stop:733 length:414 start_codon:yes stop_codon:yes gene_type:complete
MSTENNLKVSDVILKLDEIPVLRTNEMVKQALEKMSALKLGVVCVVDSSNTLKGVFTDGDVRRLLLNDQKLLSAIFVDDIIVHANHNPLIIEENITLRNALKIIEEKKVWDIPVVDKNKKLIGLLHMHRIIKKILKV